MARAISAHLSCGTITGKVGEARAGDDGFGRVGADHTVAEPLAIDPCQAPALGEPAVDARELRRPFRERGQRRARGQRRIDLVSLDPNVLKALAAGDRWTLLRIQREHQPPEYQGAAREIVLEAGAGRARR